MSLVVRGTDDSGTSVGDSGTFHMQFSKDNIDGALYYWTTSGASAIMRWDFSVASTAQAAQAYLTPANTGVTSCIGCHALAPDGSKMVVSANGQGDGRLLLWDIANNKALQPYPLSQRSQFESWNSDGTQFVGVYGDKQGNNYAQKGPVNLMIFDGMTGMVASTIDLGGLRGDHPDWSKDTDAPNTIVFTSADATAATSDQHPATGGIDYVQYDGTAWGAPMPLVPSQLGKNRYYPAISPDGDLVVYDESTCTKGTPTAGAAPDVSCDADTDPTATMFLISITNGGTPIALTNANSPGVADGANTALTNSFPKWSPFIEKLERAAAAGLADLLVDAAVRPAGAARLDRQQCRNEARDAHLDGRHQPRPWRQRPQLHGLLPAVPGHHHLEPHRPVGEVLPQGSRLTACPAWLFGPAEISFARG